MAPIPGFKASVYVSSGASIAFTQAPCTDSGDHTKFQITSSTYRYVDPLTALTIQTSPDGVTWTTITSGYTFFFCGGIIVLSSALSGSTPSVRISGAYYVVSQAMQAKTIEIQPTIGILDATTFASGGWKVKIASLGDVVYKLGQFQVDNFYLSQLGQLMVVSGYSGRNPNERIEGYGLIKTDGIKIDVKALNEESIDIEGYGPPYYTAS